MTFQFHQHKQDHNEHNVFHRLHLWSHKRLNDRITKQDNIADHKPRPHTNAYVYVSGLSVLGLAIGGYLLYNKFKKPERKLIDVPPPPVVNTNIESKRDIFEML